MRKISFTTTEYVEPIHPPVDENMANEPFAVEFEEHDALGENGPILFETPEDAIRDAFMDGDEDMEIIDAPMVVMFEEDPLKDDEDEDEDNGEDESDEEEDGGLFEEILEQIGYTEGDDDDDDDDKEDEDESENDALDSELNSGDELNLPGEEVRPGGRKIPGTTEFIYDDPEPEPEPEKITNWTEDRDPAKFMDYLSDSINRFNSEGVPGHDGRSVVGVQRAIEMLKRLDREISEAIRKDVGNDINAHQVEEYRQQINEYVSVLKEHLGKLKKRSSVSAEEDKIISIGRNALEKEAGVARIQVVMTPFERAISGILINSVVSGGKSFEDVYEFLKKKYKLTDREELSIIQIAMDSGFPIFKDRGAIGESFDSEQEKHGFDFVKNYFA
jgi:hypothetical protein